jgi:hypothetical protein
LGLRGDKAEEWHNFVGRLFSKHIMMFDEECDALAWSKNALTGEFTAKLGYNVLMEDAYNEPTMWWWEQVCKIHGPLK